MKKIVAVATALVVASSVVPASSQAGEAAKASGKKGCPQGAVCLWTKTNYRGDKLVVNKKGTHNLTAKFNNKVSSLKTRYKGGANELAFLFDKKDGNGDARCFGGDFRKVPDLSDPAWTFDDQATSVQLPKGDGIACAF